MLHLFVRRSLLRLVLLLVRVKEPDQEAHITLHKKCADQFRRRRAAKRKASTYEDDTDDAKANEDARRRH